MNYIPRQVSDLLFDLEFVAHIDKDTKIDTSTKSVFKPNLVNHVLRFVKGEGRIKTLAEISRIIGECRLCIEDYPKFKTLILEKLEKSKVGIENLKITYKEDMNIVSHLQILLESIDLFFNK